MRLHPIIDGRLYQSGKWSGKDLASCKAEIEHAGLTDFVSVWHDYPYLKPLFKHYYYLPLPDGKVIPEAAVLNLVDNLTVRLIANARMVVTCHAGRNRSGFVNALLVWRWYGISGKEALEHVRLARPRAIANPTFEKYLLGLRAMKAVGTDKPVKGMFL